MCDIYYNVLLNTKCKNEMPNCKNKKKNKNNNVKVYNICKTIICFLALLFPSCKRITMSETKFIYCSTFFTSDSNFDFRFVFCVKKYIEKHKLHTQYRQLFYFVNLCNYKLYHELP